MIKFPKGKSFFLFGPRGTGKTTWLKKTFPDDIYIDLLEAEVFNQLTANPQRIENFIPLNYKGWVILDEVQRVPELLNEIHRLIESKKIKFILTGSGARKLRHNGINLLAGRALTYRLYPLTTMELGKSFDLQAALQFGHLPSVFNESNRRKYLQSYVMTYLQQEIQQEGLTRNLSAFSRFMETASFSQGAVLNISEVAREAGVHVKVAENYFSILEDLMIAYRLPVFAKKAKRRLVRHSKFYFFDVGVYKTIRPKGPFDAPEEIDGAALETLILQECKAINEYLNFGYEIFFWRTAEKQEVDFVLYGKNGIKAIEIKRKSSINSKDLSGLKAFMKDYPKTSAYILYGGKRVMRDGKIQIIPIESFLRNIVDYIG